MKISRLPFFLVCFISLTDKVASRLSFDGHGWVKLSNNVAFQSNPDLSMDRAMMTDATNEAIDRLLASSGTNPSYAYQSIDSSISYDDYQLAWRLIGFYVDCNTTNSHGDGCSRNVLYGVYADPNYEGGGIGEYAYYDKSTDEFKCYGEENCTTKMDCHLSDTNWKLLGVFKIENIQGNNGFMGQLFSHEASCLWDSDTYQFATTMKQNIPFGCTAINQTLEDGTSLYYDAKPDVGGDISLGLYTDYACSKEYAGSETYDVFELLGSNETIWETFNDALNIFKQCQPCISYDLSMADNAFECTDAASYTNANQCYRFAKKAGCKTASNGDILLASRQQGLMSFEVDGKIYGGRFSSENSTSDVTSGNENTDWKSSFITLPFTLPTFVTSLLFLAASALFCCLGLIACCKASNESSEKNDKSVALLDASGPIEPPTLTLTNSFSSVAKSLKTSAKSLKTKINVIFPIPENNSETGERLEDGVELCRSPTNQSSLHSSIKRVDSALKHVMKSLNAIHAKLTPPDEKELLEAPVNVLPSSPNEKELLEAPVNVLPSSDAQSTTKSKRSAGSIKKAGSKMFSKIRNFISLADSDAVSSTSKGASAKGGLAHDSCMVLGKEIHSQLNPLNRMNPNIDNEVADALLLNNSESQDAETLSRTRGRTKISGSKTRKSRSRLCRCMKNSIWEHG